MSTNSSTASGGLGFFNTLTVVFIVLKLAGVITWGWFWVLVPTVIPVIALLIVGILILVYRFDVGSTIKTKWKNIKEEKKRKQIHEALEACAEESKQRLQQSESVEHRFEIMDVEENKTEPIFYSRTTPKRKITKPRFSLWKAFKTWYVEGNKKAAEKKLAKKKKRLESE